MRKKAMIFILEGPSDDTSLAGSLKYIFSSSRIEPLVMHGDITSNRTITNRNIIKRLHEEIRAFCNTKFLTKSNILRIVHIIDTDGVFKEDQEQISTWEEYFKLFDNPKYFLEDFMADREQDTPQDRK